MVSKSFNNKEEARSWAISQNIKTKEFATKNNLWGFNIVTVDGILSNVLNSRSVYAEERVDIESAYSKIIKDLKSYNIPYYVTNNFMTPGYELNNLLESMRFE